MATAHSLRAGPPVQDPTLQLARFSPLLWCWPGLPGQSQVYLRYAAGKRHQSAASRVPTHGYVATPTVRHRVVGCRMLFNVPFNGSKPKSRDHMSHIVWSGVVMDEYGCTESVPSLPHSARTAAFRSSSRWSALCDPALSECVLLVSLSWSRRRRLCVNQSLSDVGVECASHAHR